MDIIIYCFIVLLWKSTLIYKTPKETPADVASLVHKCRNQDCVHCTVKGFTSRDLCTSLSIAATKTVDCSFIKAEHSTLVSSKNNTRKILVLPNNSGALPPPVSQSFHLPFVEQSQVLAHLLFAAQCIT
jgi:hypothetical protein